MTETAGHFLPAEKRQRRDCLKTFWLNPVNLKVKSGAGMLVKSSRLIHDWVGFEDQRSLPALVEMVLWFAPTLVKCAHVYAQVDERPLSSHVVGSSDGPSPKSIVLFDMRKMPLDDSSSLGKSFLSLNGF